MSNIAISDPEKFVTGYAEFKKNGEWYDFSRFFDSQYPAYDEEAMFTTCSREKAGIRLHMETDAKAISFDVRKGKTKTTPGQFFRMMKIFSSKDKVHKFQTDENSNRLGLGKEHGECFDFLANGVLTDSSDQDQGTIRFETGYAGGEPLTLEIVFPFRKQVEISNVKLRRLLSAGLSDMMAVSCFWGIPSHRGKTASILRAFGPDLWRCVPAAHGSIKVCAAICSERRASKGSGR